MYRATSFLIIFPDPPIGISGYIAISFPTIQRFARDPSTNYHSFPPPFRANSGNKNALVAAEMQRVSDLMVSDGIGGGVRAEKGARRSSGNSGVLGYRVSALDRGRERYHHSHGAIDRNGFACFEKLSTLLHQFLLFPSSPRFITNDAGSVVVYSEARNRIE